MKKKPVRNTALRDQFAVSALHGVVVTCASHEGVECLERLVQSKNITGHQWMARLAYKLADAMLAERAK